MSEEKIKAGWRIKFALNMLTISFGWILALPILPMLGLSASAIATFSGIMVVLGEILTSLVGQHKRSVAGVMPGTARPYPGLRVATSRVGAALTANSAYQCYLLLIKSSDERGYLLSTPNSNRDSTPGP